jgi:transcriptional regulator with XRE-family HTH domain
MTGRGPAARSPTSAIPVVSPWRYSRAQTVTMTSQMESPDRRRLNDAAHRSMMARRLRDARIRMGMTARELARQLDCSPSLISQIERGKATPSVSRLFAIVTALGISMDSLFPEPGAPSASSAVAGAQDASGVVLRRDERSAINLEQGVRWERLTPLSERGIELREVFFEVGGGSTTSERAIQHNGRDYAVVTEGELTAQIGFDRFVLQPGDSCAFDATIPHQFWNEGKQRVRAVFVLLDRDREQR